MSLCEIGLGLGEKRPQRHDAWHAADGWLLGWGRMPHAGSSQEGLAVRVAFAATGHTWSLRMRFDRPSPRAFLAPGPRVQLRAEQHLQLVEAQGRPGTLGVSPGEPSLHLLMDSRGQGSLHGVCLGGYPFTCQ